MAITIFLWFSAAGWLGYGLYCLFNPATLAEFPGLVPNNPSAWVEIRAMYGGLQSAVGVLALIGALRPHLQSGVLLTLTCLYLGLSSTRGVSALLVGDASFYTVSAFGFEIVAALISLWMLRRSVMR